MSLISQKQERKKIQKEKSHMKLEFGQTIK